MAAVATKGCIVVTPSSGLVYSGGKADVGRWTVSPASPLQETVDAALTVAGVGVLHKATCGFQFKGTVGSSSVSDSASVDLEPTESHLRSSGSAVLVDGDTAHDSFGNTLTVVVRTATPGLDVN
jgi:hypothetical protein